MAGKIISFLRSPQGRDSLLTTLTEGLAMIGMVLTYRLAAQVGKQDLDVYVIVRRTVAFAFPVVLMGAMVGLTRFVAMSHEPARKRGYLRGALAWVIPLSMLTMLLAFLLAKPLAWMVYGSEANAGWIPPLALMTVGMALHGVAYGYLRGKQAIGAANGIQLWVLAIAPCAAFLLWTDMTTILWATGIAWTAFPLMSILPSLMAPRKEKMRRERSELLRYGLPRVPGDIALGALLTVPGYVALRTSGLDLSGEVGFAATLLNLAAAVFSPVALLLLPAVAGSLVTGDLAKLEKNIGRMVWMVLAASLALTVGFELLSRPLLVAYLGPTGEVYLAMSRIVFIGALPFSFFHGMRSVLDAYFHTPRNGMNLMVAFGILSAGSAVHLAVPTPWYTMGVVLVLSMFWLGWATWRDVRFVRSELLRQAVRGNNALSVLVVIPDREEGGTYSASKAQARALEAQGVEVTLFHLPSRSSFRQLWTARRRFRKLLKETRPDLVHVHFGSAAALFTVLVSAVPVVITFMGDDLDRSQVPGYARARLGGLFSQLAAFFAAGIICAEEGLRERLWWRQGDTVVLPIGRDGDATKVIAYLRGLAGPATKEAMP